MSDLKLKHGPPAHFYVAGPKSGSTYTRAAELHVPPPCARPGCGQPPEHPVHLRPPGDAPAEREAASG